MKHPPPSSRHGSQGADPPLLPPAIVQPSPPLAANSDSFDVRELALFATRHLSLQADLEQIEQRLACEQVQLGKIRSALAEAHQNERGHQQRAERWRKIAERIQSLMVCANEESSSASTIAADVAISARTVEQKRLSFDKERQRYQQQLALACQWEAMRQRCDHLSVMAQADDSWDSECQQSATEMVERRANLDAAQRQHARHYARLHRWREVTQRTQNAMARVDTLRSLDDAIAAQFLQMEAADADQALAEHAHQQDQAAHRMVTTWMGHLAHAISGIIEHGFSHYLMRAPHPERELINEVHHIAQAEGAARSRRPADSTDTRKARRAARARERRAAAKAQSSGASPVIDSSPSVSVQSGRSRLPAHASPPHAPPVNVPYALAGSRPIVRQHEERLAHLRPDERMTYVARLLSSRERGRQAVAADVALRLALPPRVMYQPIHAAIPLSRGNRLIAVRGGAADDHAQRMIADPSYLEGWLAEPGLAWRLARGPRSRLKDVAGQIIAAWSPALAEAVRRGDCDVALAYEIDRIIARLDLSGHRVVAILHMDSTSGHPHLHILFSRVRESDMSLWSLASCERAPALWLHARSNTALAAGMDALDGDIDVLGGQNRPAIVGEIAMRDGTLSVTRTATDGTWTRVAIQGPAAAQRLAAVGVCADPLAGGIWRFGLGRDPQAMAAWQRASAESDSPLPRPVSRGYWLRPQSTPPSGSAWAFRVGYGWYLLRRA